MPEFLLLLLLSAYYDERDRGKDWDFLSLFLCCSSLIYRAVNLFDQPQKKWKTHLTVFTLSSLSTLEIKTWERWVDDGLFSLVTKQGEAANASKGKREEKSLWVLTSGVSLRVKLALSVSLCLKIREALSFWNTLQRLSLTHSLSL